MRDQQVLARSEASLESDAVRSGKDAKRGRGQSVEMSSGHGRTSPDRMMPRAEAGKSASGRKMWTREPRDAAVVVVLEMQSLKMPSSEGRS